MEIEGKKILVTGGAGFIGSHLVDALLQRNCYVCVIDDLSNGRIENLNGHKRNKNFKFILGSVLNSCDIAKSMKDIDIVFHLACLGVRHSIKYPFENHRVNAEGTLLVLQEARRAGVKRFIYASSSEAYGTAQYVPMLESHPTYPCTVYGAGKLAGEAYVRSYYKTYGLKTVIIRSFNTYGPRSHHEGAAGEMIPKSIVRLLNKKPIFIFGDGYQTRDYTYVKDIAKGFALAVKCDDIIGCTLNMGSGFEVSIKEVAKMISKIIGISSPKIRYFKGRPGDVLRLCADATLLRKMTNWQPTVSLEEGIYKAIQWFKSKPEPPAFLLRQERGLNWK